MTMDVLKKDTLYRCDKCGQDFHSESEYQEHKCDNSRHAYCMYMHSSDCSSYPLRFTIIDSCFVKPSRHRKGQDGGYVFDDLELGEITVEDALSGKVFMVDYGQSKLCNLTDKVVEQGDFCRMCTFFSDSLEAPEAYDRLFAATRPFMMKRLDKELAECEEHYEDMSGICLTDFEKAMNAIEADMDGIRKMVDGGDVINICLSGKGKANVGKWKEKSKDSMKEFESLDLDDGNARVSSIFAKNEAQEKKQEKKAKYGKSDRFLMRININWADEIDFMCHDVITGSQRMELEKLAAKPNKCHISFGTNEDGDYDDIMSCLSFQKISADEYKTLERLGLLHTGDIDYQRIMDGIEMDED